MAAGPKSTFSSGSRRSLILTAFGIGLAVFLVGFGLDELLLSESRGILSSDAVTGGIAALLAYFAVHQHQVRQKENAARLQVVAEVNHHVRNALSAILLSVHVRRDPELLSITESAVARIDWVLSEVLSRYGRDTDSMPPQQELAEWVKKRDAS
jgi:hypothetical protein